jgi:hypothetical protein
MRNFKRFVLVLVLALSVAGVSIAGTNPEWKPFKLGLGPSTPFAPPVPGMPSKVEITVFGGFNSGFGMQTAENVASNLLTGMSSPWYGAGYTGFYWSAAGPATLNADIAGSMLKMDAGALAGLKLGFNLSEMIQLEAYFGYGFSGYSIDDTIWGDFTTAKARTIAAIQGISGRTVTFTDNSLQKAGKTILGGLNLNIMFGSGGSVVPYASIGGGVMSVSEAPSIAWSMRQTSAGVPATYDLDVTYTTKMAFLFSAGLGVKFYIGPNYGIKIEGRGNMVMTSIDKIVNTDFSATGSSWIPYTPYSNTALTEKGSPIFGGGLIGFFFGF